MQTVHQTRRITVAVFGRTNAGKSALVNALVGRNATEVSATPGTTGEAVYVSADGIPFGRTVFVDTVGFDADGRVPDRWFEMSDRVLDQTDLAVLVLDGTVKGVSDMEYRLLATFASREIPVVTVLTKADKLDEEEVAVRLESLVYPSVAAGATDGDGVAELRSLLREMRPNDCPETAVGDLLQSGDILMMVVSAESNAPKGQLAASHSQIVRETLEAGCLPMVVREMELPLAMTALTRPPALVVTDTTNLDRVLRLVPPDIPLTTVSLLASRQKGNLSEFVGGIRAIGRLRPGDRVLIAQGCSHSPLHEESEHRSIPTILRTLVGGPLRIDTAKGESFPDSLRGYDMVVHCNACILTRRDMLHRQAVGRRDGVPFINFAVLSTFMNHALSRALTPLRRNGALGPEFDDIVEAANTAFQGGNGARVRSVPSRKTGAPVRP